jgi:hypothetical protein
MSEMLIQLQEFSNLREHTRLEGYDYGPNGPTFPPTIEQALQAAKNDDITLLRRLYPELAEYLHLAPRKRGRPPKSRRGDAVQEAVSDVKSIRDLWKYDKSKRPQNAPPEQIAADRWQVDEDAVRMWLKHVKAVVKK